jgi:methionyl-tRNA formyltransferase
MKVLVFTAKQIGLNCIKFILENFPDDEYTFIACDPGSEEIISEIKRMGHQCSLLGDESLNELIEKPVGYYDWLLNLWGGYIFREDLLSRAVLSLNIHPSYLPYCRGRDPVVWALRYRLPAGITLHTITSGVDEGSIWYREEVHYSLQCTGGELYTRIVDRAYHVFCEKWPYLRENKCAPVPQTHVDGNRTFRRTDLVIDQRIDTDVDDSARSVILRLLAHDFGKDYQAEVILDGKIFGAFLKLVPKS